MKKILRILLVYKRSSLSVAGRLSEKVRNAAHFRANHLKHYQTLRGIESILQALDVPYHKKTRNPKTDYSPYDLIITVGGDGTMLEVARSLGHHQLLLGVNSDPDWSVGQFCHAHIGNFERVIRHVLNRSAKIKPLYKLRIILRDGLRTRRIECLNDVLICHANPAAMSRYKITIGKATEEHRNSGIWFASAAGSTGAIASAGGRKLPEESWAIQYRPRELYYAKDIDYRLTGGIIPPGQRAIVVSHMPKGRIFVDGAHVKYPFTYSRKATISHSPNFIRLVHG